MESGHATARGSYGRTAPLSARPRRPSREGHPLAPAAGYGCHAVFGVITTRASPEIWMTSPLWTVTVTFGTPTPSAYPRISSMPSPLMMKLPDLPAPGVAM